MAALVGRGIAHVPHDRVALESLGDEGAIDDPRRPGGNKGQAKDSEPGEDGQAPVHRGPFFRRCRDTENATPIHCVPPCSQVHVPVRTRTVRAASTSKKKECRSVRVWCPPTASPPPP